MLEREELIKKAQEKIKEAIDILESEFESVKNNDCLIQEYIISQLKTASTTVNFLKSEDSTYWL